MKEDTIQLSKVLREFNISLELAVEFLKSRGYKIEPHPTVHISDEIYKLLKEKFKNNSTIVNDPIDSGYKSKSKNNDLNNLFFNSASALLGPMGLGLAAGKYINDVYSSNKKKELNYDLLNDKQKPIKRTSESQLNEENSFDFSMRNFRKAKEKWDLELAPITILTGTNNSGKSSFLKSILVLDDYIKSDNHFELSFNGPNYKKHKIDNFSNALNWTGRKEGKPSIEFSLKRFGFFIHIVFGPKSLEEEKIAKGHLEKIKVRRLSDDSEFSIQRISEGQYEFYLENDILSIKDEDSSYYSMLNSMSMKTFFENKIKQLEADREKLDPSDAASINLNQELNQYRGRLKQVYFQIHDLESQRKNKFIYNSQFSLKDFNSNELRFNEVIQTLLLKYIDENQKKIGSYNEKSELDKITQFGKRLINTLKFDAFHLSPQRNSQTRLYLNENTSNDIYELINWHSQHPLIPGYDPYVFIQDWMKKFKIGEDFKIKNIEGLASIIEIKENGEWRNIVDKGFGVGQLFSIIFRIGLCINDYNLEYGDFEYSQENIKPIIIIEEPEGNLHPMLQSKLADLFYEAYIDHGVRFIIETHSEYLLRNSQVIMRNWSKQKDDDDTRIFEDNKDPRPFGAYYFDPENGPYNMIYRKDGKFKNEFGPGFFDESSNLAFEIL